MAGDRRAKDAGGSGVSASLGKQIAASSSGSVFQPSPTLFAGFALLYVLTAWLLLPPPLGTVDTAFFKEPGANLAMGQGFRSAFAFGNATAEPKLYSGYPPGLPLAFAGVAALLGVGPETNALFELLLEVIVVVLAYILLSRAFGDAPGWEVRTLFIVMLFALPSRYTLSYGDRPDSLGLVFALLALVPRPRSLPASFASALLTGFALLTSFICGFLAIVGVAPVLVS